MARFLRLIFLVCVVSPYMLVAQIMDISSLLDLKKRCSQMGSETLVVFDVDLTLTMSREPAFQFANLKMNTQRWSDFLASLSVDDQELALDLMLKNYGEVLIEPFSPHILEMLRQKNIRIMGCATASDRAKEWRLDSLITCGLDFSADSKKMVQKEVVGRFEKGVFLLRSHREDKAIAFNEFYLSLKEKPKRIIFVDDRRQSLVDLEKVLSNSGVEFIGLHYTGAEKYSSLKVSHVDFARHCVHLRDMIRVYQKRK